MNALIEQLIALRLHGMAACAQDLLASRKPPSLTTAIKQLIDAETVERQVRSICQLAGDACIAERPISNANCQVPSSQGFCHLRLQRGGRQAGADRTLLFWPVHPGCPQSHSGGRNRNRQNPHPLPGRRLQRNLPRGAIALGTTLINQGKKVRFFNAPLVHARACTAGKG